MRFLGIASITLIGIILSIVNFQSTNAAEFIKVAPKSYACISDSCQLQPQTEPQHQQRFLSQSACLLTCGQGNIWPYPNGEVHILDEIAAIDWSLQSELAKVMSDKDNVSIQHILISSLRQLDNSIQSKMRKSAHLQNKSNKVPISIEFNIKDKQTNVVTLQINESYSLQIQRKSQQGTIAISISAETVFGARHALETISQLIAFDESSGLLIAANVSIVNDRPKFAYRGLMLDLSRHFFSMESIKRTIIAMSYNKLNVLHLHLSDTASFPIELKKQSNITYYGAYSSEEVYTLSSLSDLTVFANSLGVMVIPELDGPAHIASGYQWGAQAQVGDLVICTDPEGSLTTQWTESGLGPPTGQLNLGNKNVYPILKDVHNEIIENAFALASRFHVGGDEIMVGSDEAWASCYNSTSKANDTLQVLEARGLDRNDPQSFYQLWKEYNYEIKDIVTAAFESKADQNVDLDKLHIWGGNGLDATGVTYNMMLQPDLLTALPPEKYTIQVWDTSSDSIVPKLVNMGYEVVLSHTDYVYLDCGNAGWAHAGGYWCQPYHEWQHIYEYINDLEDRWNNSVTPEQWKSKIIGSETLAWSEMISDINVDQKIWPRTSALAEALWGRSANKGQSWFNADPRLQQWTRTLQQRGIMAEPLQTQWCDLRGAYACSVNSGVPQ